MNPASQEDLRALTLDVIKQAKKIGATDAEVTTNIDSGFSVNVRKNNIETIEHHNERNISVTVYFDKHSGSATSTDLKPAAIKLMLEKASHIARLTEEDPFTGLAEKELMAHDYPDLDLYHPWNIKVDDAIELAKKCEAKAVANKKITNSEGVSVDSSDSFHIYANSHDFHGTAKTTRHSISCSLIAEKNKDMQRDYYYTIARDSRDLEAIDDVAIKATERTINRLGAKKISTQNSPIIFAAETASSLIGGFVKAIYGTNLYRKTSFLVDHLQKPVFAKHINIEENPYLPKALGSTPFDSEGVKLARSDIVTNGVLQRNILDSYSARKLSMQTTGNAGGIHNLIVKNGIFNLEGLLQKMNKGLLVTELLVTE